MEKIELDIVGLSYSQTQSGAYALVLGERGGKRRLPIIIGGFEAQAIAIELEKMTPSRPLTHDLFFAFAKEFEINFKEIVIYNLVEGIFFARLICEQDGQLKEIDARTSDAVALAVRFNCPIFTYEFILGTAGILLEEAEADESQVDEEALEKSLAELTKPGAELEKMSADALQIKLDEAIDNEDYELASKIRDIITKKES